MLSSIYTAATGMLAQETRQEALTNNLANANTVGFKKDLPVFQTKFQDGERMQPVEEIYGERVYCDGVFTLHGQGGFEQTNGQLDLAVSGDGFFVVDTPNGERYTRAGNFTINQLGELVTQEGYAVQGQNGNIVLNGNQIVFGENGAVMVDGEAVDRLRIINFQMPQDFYKEGDSLYGLEAGRETEVVLQPQILQGYLEQSNVSAVKQMVTMIEAVRSYEANQKVIRSGDETLAKTVNDVGRAQA